MDFSRGTQLIVALGLTGLVAGCSCVKKEELDAVRAEAQESRRIAEQALNTANESRQSASDADARSKKVEEATNRSFKKSMYK